MYLTYNRVNLSSVTVLLCRPTENREVRVLLVVLIQGSTILATPFKCQRKLPSKTCTSTTRATRKITGASHFFEFQSAKFKQFVCGKISVCKNKRSYSAERNHHQRQKTTAQRQSSHVQGCENYIRVKF